MGRLLRAICTYVCNAPKLPAAVLSRDYTVPTMEQGAYIVSAFYMAIVSMDTSDEVLCTTVIRGFLKKLTSCIYIYIMMRNLENGLKRLGKLQVTMMVSTIDILAHSITLVWY